MTERGIFDPLERETGAPADARTSTGAEFSSRREMRAAGAYDRRPRATVRNSRGGRRSSGGSPSVPAAPASIPTGSLTAVSPSQRPASARKSLARAGVMLVVGGLFAALAFPAYADQGEDDGAQSAPLDAQTLVLENAAIDAGVDVGEIRDEYGATSAADLRKLYADAIRQSNLAAYLASGAKELGDDYPWFAELTRYQGGGLSPLNYYYRECVDFVAWRLNRDAGSTSAPFLMPWSYLTPNGGDARQWKWNWQLHGWPTGTEPRVGAVAWFPGANHVAYVAGIFGNGSVLIEEYNGMNKHAYAQRVIPASSAYYLYAPPRP